MYSVNNLHAVSCEFIVNCDIQSYLMISEAHLSYFHRFPVHVIFPPVDVIMNMSLD